MKNLTVGVPVYKAKSTIDKLLSSVLIQSICDDVSIILANDYPDDNGSYEYVKDLYPALDITIELIANKSLISSLIYSN